MFRPLLTIVLAVAPAALATRAAHAAPSRPHAAAAMPSAEQVRLFVQRQVVAPGAARVEVEVGAPDPRLQLAPCARIEPFAPANVRWWGRASVGLRCAEGATWAVHLPVTVRIHGPALVAARPLPAQAALDPADFTLAEVEWTRDPQGVATDAAQIGNRVLTRPLAAGQPVPLSALRAPQVIAAGDPVKVVGQGRGFAVTAEAVALTAAHDGQSVRVRTDSGRVITGIARSGRRVEVPL